MNNAPVGILDSDIGGLSVVNEFRRLCPSEDILYFADTAHYPYGTKTTEEIFRCFKDSSDFLIQRGVKAILCACSTASAVALPTDNSNSQSGNSKLQGFQNEFRIPVIGMLNRELVDTTLSVSKKHKTIGLIATQLTVKSKAFEKLFQMEVPNVFSFHSQIATELVNAVTEGNFSQNKITPLLNDVFKTFPLSQLGALIIGCTHFYHLREQIRDYIFPIPLIEPSKVASLCLKQKLEEGQQTQVPTHIGKIQCFVSGDKTAFEKRVRVLEKNQGVGYVNTFHQC